mgnify:CR=1 FL=1
MSWISFIIIIVGICIAIGVPIYYCNFREYVKFFQMENIPAIWIFGVVIFSITLAEHIG